MKLSRKIRHWIESSTVPIRTPELIAIVATGRKNPRQSVWARLTDLERNGIIRRTKRATTGTFWTSALANQKSAG